LRVSTLEVALNNARKTGEDFAEVLKRTEGSIDGEYLPSHLSDQFDALMLLANRLEDKNLGTKQSHEMVAMIRAMADKLLRT
jgi:hypothetical protein